MSGVGSWFRGFSRLTDPIKKRIFKFVIKRLLGRFIEEPDLSQLDVQLPGSQTHRKASQFSGQQTDQIASFDFELKNVQLKVKEINENILMHNSKLSQSSDKDGIPFILSSGYIEKISVKIPSLMDILKESMILELNGLEVQLQFNGMNEDSGFGNAANSFLFHSTTFHDPNVLATSILLGDVTKSDIAHEFKDLEKDDFEEETDPMNSSMDSSSIFSDTKQEDTVGFNEGHTIISQAVERVISQLKAYVTNVTVRLEFPKPIAAPTDAPIRIKKEQRLKNVLLLHFPRLEYLDETPKTESWPSKFTYSFIFKGIFLQVFEEYHSSGNRVDKDDESEFPSPNVKRDLNSSSSDFGPTSNYIVNTQPSNTLDEANTIFYGETDNNKIKVNIRPSSNGMNSSIFGTQSPTFPTSNSNSKIDIEFDITSIHSVINPSQMDILLQILETLNSRGINIGFDSFNTSSKEEKDSTSEFKSFKSEPSDQIGTNAMLESIEIPITTKMSETTLIKYQEKLEKTRLHEEEVDSENFQFHTFESEPFSDESETEEHQIPEIRKPTGTPKKKTSPPIEKSPMKGTNQRFLTVPRATDTPAFGYNDISLSSNSIPCINFKIDIKLKAATFNLLYEDANLGTMWRTFFKSHDQNSGPDIPGIGHLSLRFVNGISCGVAFSTGGIVTTDNFSGIEQKNINKNDTTFHLTFGDVQLSERLCKESFGGRHIYSELKVLEFLNKPKDLLEPIIDYTYHFRKRENLVKHTLRITSQIQLSFDPGFLQRINNISSRLFSKSSLFTKISENTTTSQYASQFGAFGENFEQAILDDLDKDQTQIGAPQRVAFDILTCGILIDILLPKDAENGETSFQSTHSYKPDRLRVDCKEIKVKASFREDGNQMLIDNELYQDRIQIDKNATIIPIIVGETNLILIEKKTGTSVVKIRPMKIFATIKPSEVRSDVAEDVLYKSYISVPESISSDFYDEVEHSSLDSSIEDFNSDNENNDIKEEKYIDPSQNNNEDDIAFSIDSIEDTIIGSKALEKSKISIIIDIAEKNSKSSDFSVEISRDHFQKLNDFISKISQSLSAIFNENQDNKPSPKRIDSNPSIAIKFTSNNFTVRLLDANTSRNCVLKFKKLNALVVMFSNWISKENQKCTLINAYISNESITFYDEIDNSRSYILRREDKLLKGFRQAKNCTNISVNVEIYNKSISVQPKIFFSGLFLSSLFPTEENNWRKFLAQFFESDSKSDQKISLDIKAILQDCSLDYQAKDSSNRLILLIDKLGFHTHLNLPATQKNTIYDVNLEGMSLLLHNNFIHDIPKYLQEEIKNKRIPRSEFGFTNELHYLCFVTIASLDKLHIKFTQKHITIEESQASLIYASSLLDTLGQNSVYKSKIVTKFALNEKEKEVLKHKEPITKLEISEGTLIVNLCKDSLSTLQDVIKQISSQFSSPSYEQKVTETENPIVITYPSLQGISENENPIFTSNNPQNIFEGVNDMQFGFSTKFTNSAVTEGESSLPNRKQNTRNLPSSNNSSSSKISKEYGSKSLTPVDKTEQQSTGLMSWVTSLMNDYLTEDDSKPQIKPAITPGSTSFYPQTTDNEDDDVIVTSIYKDGVGSSAMLGHKSANKTLLSSFIQEHAYFPNIKKEDIENDSRLPLDYPTPSFELILSKCNILCHIYGGNDWTNNSENELLNTSQSSTNSSTFLQFGDLIQSTRDHTKFVQLNLNDLLLQYDLFPSTTTNVSRLSFSISDVELLDKLKESNRNKILKYWETDTEPRETNSKMFSLLHEVIKQKGSTNANEVRLDIDILPIRLNVHQSTMEFIIEFFSSENKEEINTTLQNTEEVKPTYFQHVHISPLQFKVDYQPVRVNLETVKENGITSYKSVAQMVNLVPINGAEVKIKPIQLNGISGIEEVISKSTTLILDSIDTSDIFRALLGIMPIKSMYSIGTGVADLVVLPIQSYQTDGQLLRGFRRGLSSFVTNLSVGTVQLTSNAATGVNYVVQKTDQYVKQSSGLGKFINYDYVQDDEGDIRTVPNTPPATDEDLPTNINNAIQRAYRDISTGFEDAKLAVIAIPKSGNVWTIPRVVLSPLAGMTGAISNLMIGIRSEVDSNYRQENKDLYKK